MTSSNKLMRGLYRAGPQLKVTVGNRSLGCFDLPELSGLRDSKHQAQEPTDHQAISVTLTLASLAIATRP